MASGTALSVARGCIREQNRQATCAYLSFVSFNELSSAGASNEKCLESLEARLRLPAAAINVPIRSSSGKIIGVADLVRLRAIIWPAADGANASEMRIHARNMNDVDLGSLQDASALEHALEWRERLCEVLADVDESFASVVLNASSTSDATISDALPEAIRRSCCNNQLLPMLCGSALRSVGVQPLLDAIIDYLPSPEEVVRYDSFLSLVRRDFLNSDRTNSTTHASICARWLSKQSMTSAWGSSLTCVCIVAPCMAEAQCTM